MAAPPATNCSRSPNARTTRSRLRSVSGSIPRCWCSDRLAHPEHAACAGLPRVRVERQTPAMRPALLVAAALAGLTGSFAHLAHADPQLVDPIFASGFEV